MFDAQQAAEKALKALLIDRGVTFPYVHDLADLITVLEQAGEAIPEVAKEAGRLTRFAVVARYPGLGEPVTYQEYQEAVAIAERVVRWAEEVMERM
ncbi:MAG: HEPN domain-containing protein [Dehalococcoidia bacterium]